jgi:AcrR family transcriptional regulator
MTKVLRSGPAAERFVDTALDLIAEHGGSGHVNLRQIARRMGCAHTNLYNYFADYPELLWEAFRRTLVTYGEWITQGLDDALAPPTYLRRLVTNLATFPQVHPGLYRFIASDEMPTPDPPQDVLVTVGRMKTWLVQAVEAAAEPPVRADDGAAIADILLAYIDGETLNLINDRLVPGEDIQGRIVDNALRLHRLLVLDAAAEEPESGTERTHTRYPRLVLHLEPEGD